jgi:uncharacterized protein (TIGR04551 family)
MRIRLLHVLSLVCFLPAQALAQFAPGGGMGPMPGPGGGPSGEPEKTGPAEEAPNQATTTATATAPGWPTSGESSTKFVDIDGYMRLRSDWYHQLDLAQTDGETGGGGFPTAFPAPLDCWSTTMGCKNNDISTSDMRLRIEPTVNVTESVRVKAQIDVFDNLVLGSTPQGFTVNGVPRNGWTPINAFSRTQVSPVAGFNSLGSSINAKRAWAEVRTALGELRFGRMPSQWGLGILANDGECFDCNFGDNADRVMFATRPAGYLVVVGRDWVADGPTTSITNQFETQYIGGVGQPFELYNPADVRQYLVVVGDLDKPADFQAKVDRGDAVLNWGFYGIYRWQYYDYFPDPTQLGLTPSAKNIVRDNAWAVIPDGFVHFALRNFDLQAEVVGILGNIDSLTYLNSSLGALRVEQFGGVARGEYHGYGGDLLLGAEVGYATGDQAESVDNNPNVFRGTPIIEPKGDNVIGNFRFNPDFQPDQILFRQILGTVTNATYVKPYIAYSMSRPTLASPLSPDIVARLDVETAIANVPVSTPGNSMLYGVEPDLSLKYFDHQSGFTAQAIYGILFPGAALNRPGEIFPMGTAGDARIAQTIRILLGVVY